MSLVDLGKLFFAVCVVAIHTNAFHGNKIIHSYIFALAVPFFFIASGFFLGRKIGMTKDKEEYRECLKGYGRKLLVPYLIWGIWYFFVESAANMIVEHMSLTEALKHQFFSWVIASPGGGFWYIQVILILIVVLMITDKKWFRLGLLIVSVGLSVIPYLVGKQEGEIAQLFFDSHTVLWDSLYFLAGIAIGEKWKKGLPRIGSAALFVFGLSLKIALDVAGVKMFTRIVHMIMAIGLFGLLYSVKAFYSDEMSIKFRRWSIIIYFTHQTLKYAVQMAFKLLHIPESDLIFVISIVILFIYAVIIEQFAMDKKVFKVLYSG